MVSLGVIERTETQVTFRTGHMGYTFRFWEREMWMPRKASSMMEERLRFVARLLDGQTTTDVCREFGVSRKTGYKIFDHYREHGLEALSVRSRRPVRYANELPEQIEGLIVRFKAENPHWARARSWNCWSGGSMAISGFRPKHRPCRPRPPWPGQAQRRAAPLCASLAAVSDKKHVIKPLAGIA